MKYSNAHSSYALKNSFIKHFFLLLFSFGIFSANSQTCPNYNICFSIVSESNCCRTYQAKIEGDFSNYSNIGPIYATFSTIGGGEITNIAFVGGQTNYYKIRGVAINLNFNTVSQGSNMTGDKFGYENFVYIEVCGTPGESIQLVNNDFNLFLDGQFCNTPGACDGILPAFHPSGNTISGNVVNAMTGCTNTVNNVIEGVDVNISTGLSSSSVCASTTDENGVYSCTLCDNYPFDVCVESSCPNGCGLSEFGIAAIINHILYSTPFTLEQKIAADVNQDNKITGFDIVLIRKEILGLSSTIDNWCRFVPVSDYKNTNSLSGIGDNCAFVKGPDNNSSFFRVMLGDVIGHCTDCVHGDNMGDIPIVVKENELGEYYYLSPTDETLYNFSLSIELSPEVSLSDISIESVFGENLKYNIVDGVLKLIWFDVSDSPLGYKPFKNEELLKIKTNKKQTELTTLDGCILTKSGISKFSEYKLIKNSEYKSIQINEIANIQVAHNSELIQIDCYDINGRKLESKTLSNEANYVNFELKNYPLGVYLFIINDGSQTKTIKYLNY